MVAITRINEALIQLGDTVRVERGPELKTAVATEELLENGNLANHYKVGMPDKFGNPIVLGQEFSYLDWNAPHIFHLYEYCVEEWTGPNTILVDGEGNPILDANGKTQLVLGPAWRRRGAYADEMVAVAEGMQIALQGAV